MEEFERLARGSAEAINRLVRIADRKDVAIGSSEARKNLDLSEVGVLEFVGEDETGARTGLGEHALVGVQQGMRARDHVAEGAEIFFLQPALHCREHPSDLAAATQDFGVVEGRFRLHDARNRDFVAFEALDVLGVFFWCDEFVVTAADKLQQVV